MIFRNQTLFLQFYAYRTKEVFSHLQVYTIYLVIYYIRKLAHESLLLLCSKHKIVKSKFFDQKLPKHVNSAKMQNKSPRTILKHSACHKSVRTYHNASFANFFIPTVIHTISHLRFLLTGNLLTWVYEEPSHKHNEDESFIKEL